MLRVCCVLLFQVILDVTFAPAGAGMSFCSEERGATSIHMQRGSSRDGIQREPALGIISCIAGRRGDGGGGRRRVKVSFGTGVQRHVCDLLIEEGDTVGDHSGLSAPLRTIAAGQRGG